MPKKSYTRVQPLIKPKKPKEKKAKPNGRPPKEVNIDVVRALANVGCTQEEIAAECGCSVDTLIRRFREELDVGTLKGNISIRRAQFNKAVKKEDTTMLIWLGKVRLKQKEPENSNDNSLIVQFFKHIDEMAKCSISAPSNLEVITNQQPEQISGSGLFAPENHSLAT